MLPGLLSGAAPTSAGVRALLQVAICAGINGPGFSPKGCFLAHLLRCQLETRVEALSGTAVG